MTTLTVEELNNVLAIIARAQITGSSAMTVALLQQKLGVMVQEANQPPPDAKPLP